MATLQIGGNLRKWEIKIAQSVTSETKTITLSGTSLSVIYSYVPEGSDFRRQDVLQRNATTEEVSRVVSITPGTLVIEFGTADIT